MEMQIPYSSVSEVQLNQYFFRPAAWPFKVKSTTFGSSFTNFAQQNYQGLRKGV